MTSRCYLRLMQQANPTAQCNPIHTTLPDDPFVDDLFGNVPSDLIVPFDAYVPAVVGAGLEVPYHDSGLIVAQKDSVDLSTPSPVSDH